MSPKSEDSERALLAATDGNRSSVRDSNFRTVAPSETLSANATPADSELKAYQERLQRLNNEKMAKQRYEMSQDQIDEQSKLALVSKVQRSLDRRYTNQDAEMRPHKAAVPVPLSEKKG